MTHTPRPWKIERSKDDLVRFTAKHIIGGKPSVAIWGNSSSGKGFFREIALVSQDDEANARLIASAPDLLEALKEALPFINNEISMEALRRSKWDERVRAAIAKAEGKP